MMHTTLLLWHSQHCMPMTAAPIAHTDMPRGTGPVAHGGAAMPARHIPYTQART